MRLTSDLKEFFENGGTVEYKCKESFHFKNGSKGVF